jgi:restriction system protein
MLPLLQVLSEHDEMRTADAIARLADEFRLSPEERLEMLPSGTATKFGSRTGWAKTYLKQAGLIEQPRRGVMRLTDRGREVLAKGHRRVDNNVLESFEEFRAFRSRSRLDKRTESAVQGTTVFRRVAAGNFSTGASR